VVNLQRQRNKLTRVLITGSDGFIGQNLRLLLSERQDLEVQCFTKQHTPAQLPEFVKHTDFIIHLAGVNRPQHPDEFQAGNVQLTQTLAYAVAHEAKASGRDITVILASSTQAEQDNPYGLSKRQAEEVISKLALEPCVSLHVFRLPNVFGKWCKPNYNSVVATFCHNMARDLPVQVHDPNALLSLVHVDDVLSHFVAIMDGKEPLLSPSGFAQVLPQYQITVGQLAQTLTEFRESRITLTLQGVGVGLQRVLYSTYVSYLPQQAFAYDIPQYQDPRGTFVEMLKTGTTGQISYFTAHPGVTRGGHYHHAKTEKFLVIKGQAQFRFRHMQTNEMHSLETSGDKPKVVETIPGWTHDITNTGAEDMLVMVWANEIFDRAHPDTYRCPI